MTTKSVNFVIVIIVLSMFFTVYIIPKLESDAENNFNKTFDAVKSNTELIFLKTNMAESEKTDYIINTCQIVFGNGQYRHNDVDLCKTKMGLK